MLDTDSYLQLDALAQAEGLRRGDFSAAELIQAAIQRARQLNPSVNAIISERYEQAATEAAAIHSGSDFLERSALAGIPFLIKDLSALTGLPHGYGSKLFQGHIADNNGAIVQRFVDAGLIALGKTNTPEFGLTLSTEPASHGASRNPWNPDFSTGGSSGGAAAAVASGIVAAAHASDGGGSIRIPASCCGLFGLKPSRGLTPASMKLGECWSGMSVGHVVSRSVRDSAAFLDLLAVDQAGLFPRPATPESFLEASAEPPKNLRIAVQSSHPFGLEMHPDCQQAVMDSASLCEELGHQVEEPELPVDFKAAAGAMNQLICLHTWQAVHGRLKELDQTLASAEMESSTRLMAELGSKVSAEDYIEALDTLQQVAATLARFHQDYDVILSPVLNMPVARLGWLDMNSADLNEYGQRYRHYSGYTALYNGTGQPAMSVPLHRDSNGLPLGSQFAAAWGQDALLLRLARQLEQARPWPLLAP